MSVEIRSYRRVFELERRIYRVDRMRLNPSGVPLRGVVYFLGLLAAAVAVSRLPGIAAVARVAPWYLRDVAAPGAIAAGLAVVRIDGRPFHVAARAIASFRCSRRRLVRLRPVGARADARWTPSPLPMIVDGSGPRAGRLRYTGPGALRIDVAHSRRVARGPLVALGLRPHLAVRRRTDGDGRGSEVIVLDRGVRVRVR